MKLQNKFLSLFRFGISFLLLADIFLVPHFVQADIPVKPPSSNTTPTQNANVSTSTSSAIPEFNTQPVVEYSGPEGSIKRLLCVPDETPADTPTTNSLSSVAPTASSNPSGGDLVRCINKLYRFGAVAGSFIAVLVLVVSGYMYIVQSEKGKAQAKKRITAAFAGLMLIFASYLILSAINPALTQFRPIQPPELTNVAGYKDCAAVGLPADCELSGTANHGTAVESITDGSKKGTAVVCKGGLIDTPSSIPHTGGNSGKICKDLADKLVNLKAKTGNIQWVVSATMGPGHESGCHHAGDPKAGNCADISLLTRYKFTYDKNGTGSADPDWGPLCEAVISLGGVNFANEASSLPACTKFKAYKVEALTTGPNLHVNFIGGS